MAVMIERGKTIADGAGRRDFSHPLYWNSSDFSHRDSSQYVILPPDPFRFLYKLSWNYMAASSSARDLFRSDDLTVARCMNETRV